MKRSERLSRLPPYLFAELERKIAEKRAAGVAVISLGLGAPDTPTPELVIDALAEAARDPGTHQYPSNRGRPEFREAVAGFYARRFGRGPAGRWPVSPPAASGWSSTRRRRSSRRSAPRSASSTSTSPSSTPATPP